MAPTSHVDSSWKATTLGEILREVNLRASDVPDEASSAEVLSLTKNLGLIPQSDRFAKRIATADVSRYKLVRKGWLVYNPYVLWEGAIHALRNTDIGLVSPVYHVWQSRGTSAEFLDYLLKTPPMLRAYLRVAQGTVKRRRAVRTSAFKKLSISLPPTPEQEGIARALDTLQKAKKDRQRELVLECERKAALTEYLVTHGIHGEPTKQTQIGEIPESWKVVELGEVARIGNGSTPKRSDERYWKAGTIPWITSTQIHDVVIRHANELVTETARKECHLPLVPKGSVVVAITGQGKTLGNAALLAIDTCINQHLAYVQFERSSLQAEFALVYLQSKYAYLRGIASGGGSTKGALTCGFLKTMSVPVPPRDEQFAISELVLCCDKKRACLERELELLDELFDAMLEKLMSGQLSVTPLIGEPQPQ